MAWDDTVIKPRLPANVSATNSQVRLALRKNSKGTALAINIGVDLVSKMGWLKGDRVTILFDRELNKLGLRRSNQSAVARKLQQYRKSGNLFFQISTRRISDDLKDRLAAIGQARVSVAATFDGDALSWSLQTDDIRDQQGKATQIYAEPNAAAVIKSIVETEETSR